LRPRRATLRFAGQSKDSVNELFEHPSDGVPG
jgi:hypothetical protein